MEREIIIERKKSKSIKTSLFLFIISLIMILPILFYFVDFEFITSEVPLIAVIGSIIALPILISCTGHYFKQIFNNNPVLIINEQGIDERMSFNYVGIIKWDDIENITVVPYMDNTYFIGIILKSPEKYIKNEKLLNRLNKQKGTKKWGHISFSSFYFKKEFESVIALMMYYYKLHTVNEL